MMWWLLMEDMMRYLALWPGLDFAQIELGQHQRIPDRPTVQISRGSAGPDEVFRPGEGSATLFVDCWAHSEDEDWGVGYEALADLERSVIDALQGWQRDGPVLDEADWNITEVTTQPDFDSFRPSVGSRLTVRIAWQRSM